VILRELLILGTGCAKCSQLEVNAREAVAGTEAEVRHVSDIGEIMKYGVMMTPALVIDGQVKSVGKVLPVEEIKGLL